MSDWEDDIYDDGDEEDEELSFEEDSEDDNRGDVEMRNSDSLNVESLYFKAKHFKEEENLAESISLFDSILQADEPVYDYKFKSMKQLLKIYQHQKNINQEKRMLQALFTIKDNIDSYYFSSSILKIVNRIRPNVADAHLQLEFLIALQNLTMDEANSTFEKIKVKTVLLISKIYTLLGNYAKAKDMLLALESQIQHLSESTKKTYFLEILTSQIFLLLTHEFDLDELERLVTLTKTIELGIPHTSILGIKNEGSGLVSMYAEDYISANRYFLEAFKNFNDSGDFRRVSVLAKYIVTSILSKSEVNPFQSSDFQGFLEIETINFLMQVYNAFQSTDIKRFNELLNDDILGNLSLDFAFLRHFVPALRETIYTDFICGHINLFDRVEFQYFTEILEVDLAAFKRLLLKLYNTGKIVGYRFDLVNNHIIKAKSMSVGLDAHSFIDAAFKYYDISNPRIYDIFKSEYKQLMGNSLAKDIENIQRKTQSQLNMPRPEEMSRFINQKINDFSFLELDQSNMNLDKSLLNEDLNLLRLNASYNPDTLRQLSRRLFDSGMINKDLSKDTHIRNTIISYIDQFIAIAKNSIPIQKKENVSYLNKINDSKVVNEFNKLFHSESTDITFADTDPNIPDVIQTSTMNQLDIPSNPDYKNDPDLTLSHTEKQLRRLELIENSILLMSQKQLEADVRFCNLRPTLHSTLSRTKLKRPAPDMGKFKVNRFRNGANTFDFSETTSIDNMSLDGDAVDEEEDEE